MCGILAYHGRSPALPALIDGLERLEYRGYDSVGVALASPSGDGVSVYRVAGRIPDLVGALPPHAGEGRTIGIGHTRWATHGPATAANAHPHRDCTGTVQVVHNGTIENAPALRAELTAAGHQVLTEVDTEVVAHLVEQELRTCGRRDLATLAAALTTATSRLEGSYALAVTASGVAGVVLARRRSPLLVAESGDALMAASDAVGFPDQVATVRELRDGDVVALGPDCTLQWFDRTAALVDPPAAIALRGGRGAVDLHGAPDHTAKEIAEEPAVAQRLVDRLAGRLTGGGLLDDLGLEIPARVRLIACGSSAFAAHATARVLTTAAGIPARVVIASEHAGEIDEPGTLTVAFSQSGETADLLAARAARGGRWLAVTNGPQSSLARSTDSVFDLDCGPELGVAATKSFVAQVIAGTGLALAMGIARDLIDHAEARRLESLLRGLPDRLAATDAMAAPVAAELATQLAGEPGWIYVSRGSGVPYAAEGALKLKELAYRWVEMLPAGELKHGPIALVQPGTPVVVVRAEPAARLDVNVAELVARGARIVTVGGPDATLPALLPGQEPPWGPLETVVALQHLAREVARQLACDVDRPRNLAKSVTVE